jgi:hypothetical protein
MGRLKKQGLEAFRQAKLSSRSLWGLMHVWMQRDILPDAFTVLVQGAERDLTELVANQTHAIFSSYTCAVAVNVSSLPLVLISGYDLVLQVTVFGHGNAGEFAYRWEVVRVVRCAWWSPGVVAHAFRPDPRVFDVYPLD